MIGYDKDNCGHAHFAATARCILVLSPLLYGVPVSAI